MLKNAKWLIFGGIGYRFRGFLIGVAVGFGLSSFAPSAVSHLKEYISWFVPSAYAAPYYDFNELDSVNTVYSVYSVPNTVDDSFALGEQVEANSDGTLTHIQARILRDTDSVTPIALPGTFSFEIYEATVGGHAVGALLGQSADYDPNNLTEFVDTAGGECDIVDLDTDCPSTTYSIFPEFSGALDFSIGDLYWVFVEYYDGDGNAVGGGERLEWVRSPNTSDGLYVKFCDLLPNTNCTQSNSSGSGNDLKLAVIFDDGSPFEEGIFSVGLGPHISLDPLTYNLSYLCGHAGDIWGYDTGVDSDYQDLGISCLSGDSGFIELDLSGSLSEWLFELRFDDLPVGEASATVYYNPNNVPILPPDGSETVDLDFCFPFLISDEEEQEAELDVDEEISSGFLAWAKGVAVAAFSSIYGGLVQVPVIGDYMLINCMMYDSFIGSLDPDSDLLFTMNFDGFMDFDDTDEISVDLSSAVDEVGSTAEGNPRYEAFREVMTALFCFVLFWKVWMILHPDIRQQKEEDKMSPY